MCPEILQTEKTTYYIVNRSCFFQLQVSKETYPDGVSKETYYSVKRDLLHSDTKGDATTVIKWRPTNDVSIKRPSLHVGMQNGDV